MPKLSVLDQSLRYGSQSASAILGRTQVLAQHADALGYHRFWVSEHHGTAFICGSAPEVLMASLAAQTKRIRIGSGGVMLPHYSPYKVAEQFATLSCLYPDRIDCGLGRAPGGDMAIAYALSSGNKPRFDKFGEQVQHLRGYLTGVISHPHLSPEPQGDIPIFILGTSPYSAQLAALLGLPYALALFINPQVTASQVESYRRNYQPSEEYPEPYVMLAATALACDDADYASRLEHNAYVNLAGFFRDGTGYQGINPDTSDAMDISGMEAMHIAAHRTRSAYGEAHNVVAKLDGMIAEFGADELMITANAYHQEDRQRSLELIANAYGLEKAADIAYAAPHATRSIEHTAASGQANASI